MRWITDLGSVYFKSGFIVTVVVIDLYLIKHPWICSHKAALLIIILSPKGRYWLTECVVTLLFSCSVLSDSLRPHELQHTRLPYPSLFPWICSNSYPLSQWYLPTISSSVALNLSQHQGLFQWVGSLHQVAKYWSSNFSTTPSNEYSELISFQIDWFDLVAAQGTLINWYFFIVGTVPSIPCSIWHHCPPSQRCGWDAILTLVGAHGTSFLCCVFPQSSGKTVIPCIENGKNVHNLASIFSRWVFHSSRYFLLSFLYYYYYYFAKT